MMWQFEYIPLQPVFVPFFFRHSDNLRQCFVINI